MIVEAVVTHVSRKNNSASGNPTKVLHLQGGGSYQTKKDAAVIHAISDQWVDVPLAITLDERFEIIDVKEMR